MKKNSLAFKMSVALVLGIIAGTLAIIARENVSADTWQLINKLLFADISQSGNENALGLFYIIGQLFIKSLQLIIVPMVFTSITLAMVKISDAKKLGRISTKTVLTFLILVIYDPRNSPSVHRWRPGRHRGQTPHRR